jgi:hypothetical protein
MRRKRSYNNEQRYQSLATYQQDWTSSLPRFLSMTIYSRQTIVVTAFAFLLHLIYLLKLSFTQLHT